MFGVDHPQSNQYVFNCKDRICVSTYFWPFCLNLEGNRKENGSWFVVLIFYGSTWGTSLIFTDEVKPVTSDFYQQLQKCLEFKDKKKPTHTLIIILTAAAAACIINQCTSCLKIQVY